MTDWPANPTDNNDGNVYMLCALGKNMCGCGIDYVCIWNWGKSVLMIIVL